MKNSKMNQKRRTHFNVRTVNQINRLVVLCGAAVMASAICTQASVPVMWETPITHSNQNEITNIKLTPDGNSLIVFHFNNSGEPLWVEKVGVAAGNLIWTGLLPIQACPFAARWMQPATCLSGLHGAETACKSTTRNWRTGCVHTFAVVNAQALNIYAVSLAMCQTTYISMATQARSRATAAV